ncbi:MAG: indolepyruvate ferredoxin oxidoreductase subunit alpha [Firmicutes bacterium]|nr:indolepyruvate ferredoxin oxidoreductase subunit alpha [Bacillota bacterium]
MKELLSGNAAIARGAFEAGVTVATGYPGTPSTEILENLARYPGVYAQWSPNEKVALEVGVGASLAGARVLVAMKHVGVNVAADPLMTLAYTGVNGGLVLVSADDPGMHSSQNEQDNRYLARMAGIPMLEPSDSQEAKDMVALALDLSETFDIPVMLRTTTRVSHSQSLVELGARREPERRPYRKDAAKYVMVPAHARKRRLAWLERQEALRRYAEECPVNVVVEGGDLGIVTSGVAYQYALEAYPGATVLKLGLTNPLPAGLLRRFAERVRRILVVEELEPYLEEQLRALGLTVEGKTLFPRQGELDPVVVARAGAAETPAEAGNALPARPPVLCPGCPHRGVLYVLSRLRLTVMGDIGCYTLGVQPPLAAMDSCLCMGASIGMALGMEKAAPEMAGRTVAVIGDSTFFHSGLTGLLDIVYNRGRTTVIILDNGTTAMTGHQDHPGTGRTLLGEEAPKLDLEQVVRGLGVRRVAVVDPYDLAAVRRAVREETAAPEPSVIIARRPCSLTVPPGPVPRVDPDACTGCGNCLRLGCPALALVEKVAVIDAELCRGCGLCRQVCKTGAIREGDEERG